MNVATKLFRLSEQLRRGEVSVKVAQNRMKTILREEKRAEQLRQKLVDMVGDRRAC